MHTIYRIRVLEVSCLHTIQHTSRAYIIHEYICLFIYIYIYIYIHTHWVCSYTYYSVAHHIYIYIYRYIWFKTAYIYIYIYMYVFNHNVYVLCILGIHRIPSVRTYTVSAKIRLVDHEGEVCTIIINLWCALLHI
jgi:hypothetical protein